MKRIIDKVLGVLLLVFLVVFTVSCVKAPDLVGNLGWKMATSICFVLDGLLWFDLRSGKSKRFPIIFMIGIVFMMLGDFLIYYSFVAGALAFALGHIIYIIAYYVLSPINKNDFLFAGIPLLFSIVLIEYTPVLEFNPPFMKYVCLVYSLIISYMVSKSLSNYLKIKDSFTLVLCLGSVMFLISDIMVLLDAFAKNPWIYTHIGHALYFPGQFVLAQGIRKYYEK